MLVDEARSVSAEDDLPAALNRTLRELDKAKASREELVDAVYRAAKDAAASITIPPIPKPKAERKGRPEVAICLLADWQLGKVTPDYSSEVAIERVARYGEKVAKLVELQRSHH